MMPTIPSFQPGFLAQAGASTLLFCLTLGCGLAACGGGGGGTGTGGASAQGGTGAGDMGGQGLEAGAGTGGDGEGGTAGTATGGDGGTPSTGGASGTGGASSTGGATPDPNAAASVFFNDPADLGKFVVDGVQGEVTVANGALNIAPSKQHTAVFDTTPDGTPSNPFDLEAGPLTITFRVKSNTTPVVPPVAIVGKSLPRIWLSFFPQQGRTNAARMTFSWQETSNDSISFGTGYDLTSSRATVPADNEKPGKAILTPIYNGDQFYEVRTTLTKKAAGMVHIVTRIHDGTRIPLEAEQDLAMAKLSGEIAVGGWADSTAPLLIDDFQIIKGATEVHTPKATAFHTSSKVHLWIPPGVTTVKTLWIESPGCCGVSDGTWDYHPHYRNFARAYDMAIVGHDYQTNAQAVAAGINQLADDSGHPELKTMPVVIYGFSAGSKWTSSFVSAFPGRVIAFVADAYSTPNDIAAGSRGVPGLFVCGASNDLCTASIVGQMQTARTAGARFGFLEKEKLGHAELGTFFTFMPFFHRAFANRFANRTLPLLAVDDSKAWLIQTGSWNDTVNLTGPVPMPKIFPIAELQGNVRDTGWLMDKDTAFVAAAYTGFRRAVHITPIFDAVEGDSRTVTVRVLDSMKAFTKVELYDYATLIHTFAAGAPLDFEMKNLTAGVHAPSAQLTFEGKVYVAFPQTFVVVPK